MTRSTSVARTHVGLVRLVNEDRLLDRPDRGLWAVADGMGGHHGGDIAAELAIDALRRLADGDDAIVGDAVTEAIADANAAIFAEGQRRAATIGTTLVGALLDGDAAEIFWAGDSRAYLLRDGTTTQLTTDHSLVQELVDAGAITPAQARSHPRANVVTRALGTAETLALDRRRISLTTGDRILLCSDGLSRTLHDDQVISLPDDEHTADRLLDAALRLDGSDNVTLILIYIGSAAGIQRAA